MIVILVNVDVVDFFFVDKPFFFIYANEAAVHLFLMLPCKEKVDRLY